ncbi:hypothetical protein JXJ21_24190 [candidate division KSB1 bacterium]|nr:hypothetical protein [candidate division KSB1 bacterium]
MEIKFGRDYFMPGIRFNENLLFSNYSYTYDQIKLAFRNRIFELSSFYLSLNSLAIEDTVYKRHLNEHRLSINLFNSGYIAINEVIVYGGVNRAMKPALLNPLLFYYPYQKNTRYFRSNSLISMELFYQHRNLFGFLEFLVDDYQVDHSVSSDLEPNEYGYNLTIGIKQLLPGMNWSINHTKVSNRTYNVEVDVHEKYIYKNLPIGHYWGNNFWEISTKFSYANKKTFAELRFSYLEYGDEALYSAFNTDYLYYAVEEGYEENFPFGTIHKQAGSMLTIFYSMGDLVIGLKIRF